MAKDVLQNAPVVGMKRKFPRSFGRYILEKSLSRGGMGEVFLALAKGVNQRCVIKTIRGDLTGDEEFIGRFADEAKIMVRIAHDNIIRVFDAGKVEDDYYIAMEYVHGRDLGDVLDRAYERGEPMPMQLGLYVSAHLLEGLHYAHALTDEHGRPMGVVHRDISPQNVLIGFDGSVKLIDFGLARSELLPARTQGALAVGKYGYMSPEQARHEKIDGRADIYSSGVMLFEVFTGDRLVDEQDQSTLWQRVLNPKHRPPRAVVPSLPKDIDDLIMKAIAVKTDHRYRDAREMLTYVNRMRTSESTRDPFIRYLRYLYPKADFNAPPIPQFDGPLKAGTEQSLIIATSREGALSVFGRGNLAIEGTQSINAEELRKELLSTTKKPPGRPIDHSGVEATHIRDRSHEHRRALETNPGFDAIDPPTQIARLPGSGGPISAPNISTLDDEDDPDKTLQAAPVRGLEAFSGYRDDEMTVMMDAPPAVRAARPQAPSVRVTQGDEATDSGEHDDVDDTRLSTSPINRRAIKEKVTAPPARRRVSPAPPPPQPQVQRKIVALRETIPTKGSSAPAAPQIIEPYREIDDEEEGSSLVMPAFIMLGLVVLIVVTVLLIVRL